MYTYQNGLSKFVPIAPNTNNNMDYEEAPKKYNYKGVFSGAQAASIAKRNARERNRVKQVNDGFNALRKRLPAAIITALSGGARRGSGKKLSKVDTLRMVVEYIRYLEQLIEDSGSKSTEALEESISHAMDEGMFAECDSSNSESVPSPAPSESCSGVSCYYSENDYYTNTHNISNEVPPMNNDFFDSYSW